ncbi:MAG: hypothetical protein LW701_04825 [Fluviicola sp.]|nr:hypothetical protein [Fluviicola sp.]
MKILLSITLFFLSYITIAQYVAPIPTLIQLDNLTKANGGLKTAWFYPQNEMQVVGQFQKAEVGFSLPLNYNRKIINFFQGIGADSDRINPYNRHDIDITVEIFKDSILKKSVDAFYYEEFLVDTVYNVWKKDTTSYDFRARFSLAEVGQYEVVVKISSMFMDTLFSSFSFNVIPSNSTGYIEKASDNKHLRFSASKESFMGVGQVVPWAEANQGQLDQATRPSEYKSFYKALNSMHSAGGTFTRFVASPWFMELEWEALGNYSPKLGQAWEFDRIDELCGDLDLHYIFCLRLHTQLENHKDRNGGLRWEDNCYNDNDESPSNIEHEPAIGISKVIDFYSNEIAKDHNKNYFRYMISRWGYSCSLAAWQVMSEIDNTADYRDVKKGDSILSHVQNRVAAREWTHEMIKYIDGDLKDAHLLSVAVATGKDYSSTLDDPELLNIPEIDFIGLHDYVYEVQPPTGKIRNRNLSIRYKSVNNFNIGFQNGSISYPEFQKKLFIYDEFGQMNAVPKDWPLKDSTDPTVDYNNCLGFMMKQDLWFTAVAGCGVAGLDWWNYSQEKRVEDWKLYYPGIKLFFEGIDFENVNYSKVREFKSDYIIAQRWPYLEKEINASSKRRYTKSDLIEAYTQVNEKGEQAFGWLSNRSFHWANLINDLPCVENMYKGISPYAKKYLFLPSDDDKVDAVQDVEVESCFFKVNFLKKKTVYVIEYFNTLTNERYAIQEVKTSNKGVLKIYVPKMDCSITTDLAYKIVIKGNSFK